MKADSAKWAYLRSGRRLFLFAFLAGLPCISLVNETFRPRVHSDIPFIASGAVWFLLIYLTSSRLSKFRCPRCGEYFAHPDDYVTNTWTLASKCRHCGLRKYSEW